MSAVSGYTKSNVLQDAKRNCIEDYIAATFAYEFMDGVVDMEAIERLHRGDVREWVTAVAASGLFTAAQIDRIDAGWQCNPRSLLDALLSEADEVTVKRCETAWAGLTLANAFGGHALGGRREPLAIGAYNTVAEPAVITIA
ncbi:hypothetical protein [Prescottella subtropica]|uniref:hypothetical protein n=1 Tax=Prescottella subtropica TaxID=2545757 RepID=UPI001F4FC2EF|nr:hypothetical protein [Prescottella subtropica]